MHRKSRFTFRSLDRDARDLDSQAVWSATPGTDELAYLQTARDALAATRPAPFLTPELVESTLRHVRESYPEARAVRFEFDPHEAQVDETLRVVYVDLSGRLWLTGEDGREFTTEEFDYLAAQTGMALIEQHVSRTLRG